MAIDTPGKTYYKYETDHEINPAFDDILWKIMYVDFGTYGFQTVSSDADNPVELNTLVDNNNYRVDYYVNGPMELGHTPIIILVSNHGEEKYQCIIHMLDIYYRHGLFNEGGVVNWCDWKCAFNSTVPIHCNALQPEVDQTLFNIWIDTSINGFPVIRAYHPTEGWISIGSLTDVMYATTYDTENRMRDIFLYLDMLMGKIRFLSDGSYELLNDKCEKITPYNFRKRYIKHLDLGHMTSKERAYFEETITKDEFKKLHDEYKTAFLEYAKERIGGKVPELIEYLENEELEFERHTDDASAHTPYELRHYWDLKADHDHTHFSDFRVRIDASQIVSGIIDADRLPTTLVERLVRVKTHKDRFNLDTFDVQNGDSVFVMEETDEYESGFYLVINQYQLANDTGWLHYRTERLANIDFADIGKKPTTYEGYGIKDHASAIMDETITPDENHSEMVYPYQDKDGTFNSILYWKVTEFYRKYEKILYDIGEMIVNHDIYPMKDLINFNIDDVRDVDSKWDPYSLIGENTIRQQHEENVIKDTRVREVYERMCTFMYDGAAVSEI